MRPQAPYKANDFAKHFAPLPPRPEIPHGVNECVATGSRRQFSKNEIYTILGFLFALVLFAGIHFIRQNVIMAKLDGLNEALIDIADQEQLKTTEEISSHNQTNQNENNIQPAGAGTGNEKVGVV